ARATGRHPVRPGGVHRGPLPRLRPDLGGCAPAPVGETRAPALAALASASVNALVYSSSLVAAFLGGVLALFAPCCVVSLLPTFVGAALERGRLRLPAMAAIFAAGIA